MEVFRARENLEYQKARAAIRSNEDAMNREGFHFRETSKHEAQEHVRLQEAQTKEKVQAYQRVTDANHRQSMSSKEQEITSEHDGFPTCLLRSLSHPQRRHLLRLLLLRPLHRRLRRQPQPQSALHSSYRER